MGHLLGSGSYAKVKLAHIKDSSNKVAVKIACKSHLRKMKENYRDDNGELKTRSALEKVYNEIQVLEKCKHPRIPKLIDVFEDDFEDRIYIIMEYVPKGALVDWDNDSQSFVVKRAGEKHLSEDEIRKVLRGAIEALEYCRF